MPASKNKVGALSIEKAHLIFEIVLVYKWHFTEPLRLLQKQLQLSGYFLREAFPAPASLVRKTFGETTSP
jgi:hypothetical protein